MVYEIRDTPFTLDEIPTHGQKDSEVVQLTEAQRQEMLTAWNADLQRIASEKIKQYQRDRSAEYPPIGDQLDALWKGGDEAAAMLAKVQAVKAKYPKEQA